MAKYNDFCSLIEHDKPSIVLLTETWLNPAIVDGLVSLNGYTIFRKDRLGSKGGGFFIHLSDLILSNFRITPVPFDNCSVEGLFLTISNKTVSFVVGCVIDLRRPRLPRIKYR